MRDGVQGWLDAAAGSDEEFVERAWLFAVRRSPEDAAREAALEKLRDGTLSRAGLLRQLVTSDEFERVALLDTAVAFAAARALAAARRQRTCTAARAACTGCKRRAGDRDPLAPCPLRR